MFLSRKRERERDSGGLQLARVRVVDDVREHAAHGQRQELRDCRVHERAPLVDVDRRRLQRRRPVRRSLVQNLSFRVVFPLLFFFLLSNEWRESERATLACGFFRARVSRKVGRSKGDRDESGRGPRASVVKRHCVSAASPSHSAAISPRSDRSNACLGSSPVSLSPKPRQTQSVDMAGKSRRVQGSGRSRI